MRSYLKKITLLALAAAANAELVKRDPYWIKMSDVIQQVRPDFYYGVSTQRNFFSNPKYKDVISTYNLQVPGNECKFYTIQGSEKENFKPCDDAIAFAKTFNAKVRGHTLFWPAYSSDWFKTYSDDVEKNKEYMIDYVTRVLEHYKDEEDILYWDVINESVLDDSTETNIKLRTGSDTSNEFKGWEDTYTEDLFKLAREHTNPNVKLIYNDYNAENNNGNYQGKTGAVFEYIKSMREKDVPIDGVGLQMHISCNYYPNYDQLTTLIDKYAEIGVEVHITEIDVSMDKCKTHDEQRELYMDVFKACFDHENCKVFTVWGAYDSESWKGAENEPLPFDKNMYPKDIYFDMLDYVLEKLPADATYPTPTATKPAEEPTVVEDENINYLIEPGTYMIDPHWQSWSWGNEEVTIDDDGNVVTTLIQDEYGALSLHSSTKFNGGKLHIEMMIDKAAPVAIVAHTIKDEGFNEIERIEDVSTTEIQAFDIEIPDVEGDDYDRISVQDAWGKAITLTIHKMYFIPNTDGASKPANPANAAGSKKYDILKEGDFMLDSKWQNWSWGVEDNEFDDDGNLVSYITAGTYGGVSFKRSDGVTFGAGTLHFKAKVNDTNAQIQILMHTVSDEYVNVGSVSEVSDEEMLEYNISVDEPTGDLYDRITIQDVANNGLTLILNDIYFVAAELTEDEQPTDVDVEETTDEPTGTIGTPQVIVETQTVAEPTQIVAEPAQTVVEEPTVDPVIEGDNVYYMLKNGVVDPAWQNWSWGVESAEVDKDGNFANVLTAGEWGGISFKRSDSTLFGAGTLHFKAKADTANAKIQIVAHSTAADEYFNIDVISDLSTTKMTEYSIEVAEPEAVKYDRFTIQDIYNEGVTLTINNVYFVANPVADEDPTEVEPIDEPTEVEEPVVEEQTDVEPEVDPVVEGDNVYYIVKNGEVDPAWQNWSWGVESAEVDKDGNFANVLTAGEWGGISFKRSDSTLFGDGTLYFKAKADTADAVIQIVAHSTAADEYFNMGTIRDLSTTKMTEYSIEVTETADIPYDRFTIQDIYNQGVTLTINNVYFVAAESEAPETPETPETPEVPEVPEECWATELGFNCCKTTTRVVLEDESGSWGVEDNFWCGIVENKDDTCWSTKLGYPCCKENNIIYEIDQDGSWGYENEQWCGIAKADESCEFSALGYACCPNARVVAKDEHKWGFVDGQWCGVAF